MLKYLIWKNTFLKRQIHSTTEFALKNEGHCNFVKWSRLEQDTTLKLSFHTM